MHKENKDKNEIKVYISIYGDQFDPEELTRIVQVTPIHTHLKGEIIPLMKGLYRKPDAPPPLYKETAWDYGSQNIKTDELEVASKVVEEGLKDKVPLINQFVQKHNLTVKLSVVPWMDKKSVPLIYFNPTFVKMLGELNADIFFDTYII